MFFSSVVYNAFAHPIGMAFGYVPGSPPFADGICLVEVEKRHMKLNLLALTLSVSLLSLSNAICFAASTPSATTPAPKKGASSAPKSKSAEAFKANAEPLVETAPATRSANLSELLKAYKAQSDPETWDKVFTEFYAMIGSNYKASAASVIAANPLLNDVGARCVDGGAVKIWTFTKVPNNQAAVILWQNVTAGPEEVVRVKGRKRVVRGEAIVSWKGQMMRFPAGLMLKEAKLVRSSVAVASPAGAGAKKIASVESVRALVLAGNEKNGNSWLHAFKQSGSNWIDSPEIFGSVPPFLLQNLAGKVTFANNDLIVSVGMPSTVAKVADETGKGATTGAQTANGYRIILHFLNGKYVLDSKTGEEGPFAVAQQFATAVSQNRVELAKGWMAEGKLIAIPHYAGLLGHSPLRVMPMANPGNGNTRFRLVSFQKEDLIIDIGKIKTQQLAVKAIYVAPADPLAQKLLGTLSASSPAASSTSSGADASAADAK